jgi:hypothetical protein
MNPPPAPYLSRAELIEGLRGGGRLSDGWEAEWAAELLEHASAERLSADALAALAVSRRCLILATEALQALNQAQLALADALEAAQL